MTNKSKWQPSSIFPSKLKRLLARRKGKPEPVSETLNVLMYEIGDLHKALTYSRFYPEFEIAYRAEARAALADAIAQLELLAETLKFDWEELRELGDQRFLHSDELDRRHAMNSTEPPPRPDESMDPSIIIKSV